MIRVGWRLVVSALTAALAAACQQPPAPSGAAAPPPQPRGHQLQVVAHPDDDILFLNPDLAAGIHQGQPTTSVYLTGGESDLPNSSDYASHRQDGTRAAYARMAGVPDSWIRRNVPVGDGRLIEMDTLAARPEVRLAFLNLPEDNDPAAAGGKHALARLWEDGSGCAAVDTLRPTAGTVRSTYPYRRNDVVDVLDAVFDLVRPSILRTQDPYPDARYQPQWAGYHDHPDHVVTARFVHEAAQRSLSRPGHRTAEINYRDYNIADSPIDLSQPDQSRKRDYFAAYVRHDIGADLGGAYEDWTERSYYRWSRGPAWSNVDGQGHVHAFAVYGTQVVHWTRDAKWTPPEVFHAPTPLRPAVTVLADNSGRLVLLAQAWDGSQVLLKRQLVPGGAWQGDWTSLGTPQEGARGDTTQAGAPAATTDQQGRLLVFVGTAGGSVSMRREYARGWEAWANLGGSDVQGSVAAVHDAENHLHLFASTQHQVLHWQQETSGTFALTRTPFRKIQPVESPVGTRAPGGRSEVFVRTGENGALAGVSAAPPLGWQVPVRLANPGGIAAPTVAARHGPLGPEFVLFVRNSHGGVSASRADGHWVDLGGQFVDQPTAVVEPDGSITVLATADNGTLMVDRDLPGTSGLAFRGWQPAVGGHSG